MLSGVNTFTGGVTFTGVGALYLGDGNSVGTVGKRTDHRADHQ